MNRFIILTMPNCLDMEGVVKIKKRLIRAGLGKVKQVYNQDQLANLWHACLQLPRPAVGIDGLPRWNRRGETFEWSQADTLVRDVIGTIDTYARASRLTHHREAMIVEVDIKEGGNIVVGFGSSFDSAADWKWGRDNKIPVKSAA